VKNRSTERYQVSTGVTSGTGLRPDDVEARRAAAEVRESAVVGEVESSAQRLFVETSARMARRAMLSHVLEIE
jgi:hypothetical protein